MALIHCPNCGRKMSDKALKCPQCEMSIEQIKIILEQAEQNKQEVEQENLCIDTSEIAEKTDKKEIVPLDNSETSSKSTLTKEDKDAIFKEEPKDNQQEVAIQTSEAKRISTRVLILIIIGLFLIAGGVGTFFYYKNVYLPEKRDAEAPRYYVMAQNLNMRSTPEFEADYNKIGSFPYGTEIIIYDSVKAGITWYFYGKYAPKDAKGKTIKDKVVEGYLAYDFMASKADFFLLNSIFGNEDARKMLSEARYKKALLNYFKQHGYRGDISRDQIEKYGISNNYSTAERWQVFCKYEKAKSNNVYRSRKYRKDSKYADAAIIIKNIDSGERRLLYFVFDDDETSHLLLEQNVPSNGYMKDGTLKLKQSNEYMNYGEYFVDVEYQYDDFL